MALDAASARVAVPGRPDRKALTMDSHDVRSTFLHFYRERGHRRVQGTSLIPPDGDPVLFTTSGMHPLTPHRLGEPHQEGRRLVNVQRCLRTTDLDEVGDDTHLTVFEMLGTWSLGDYPGSMSLRWGYELLREGFGLDHDRLHVTVFGGDEQVGPDLESLRTWRELGVPVELTVEDNWWSNGPTGPCGPDSEVFVWTGEGRPTGTPTTDSRWVEVWNHVMMRHRRLDDGRLVPLDQPNVDTGMGLERLLTVLQGVGSVHETDLLRPWTDTVGRLWPMGSRDSRVVSDHLRSGTVVIGDGVRPSSSGRGYVLRRLVRRSLTLLWRHEPGSSLSDLPVDLLEDTLRQHGGTDPGQVREVMLGEERRFGELVRRGRPLVERRLLGGPLTEEDLTDLHQTHGLPRDLVLGLLGGGR